MHTVRPAWKPSWLFFVLCGLMIVAAWWWHSAPASDSAAYAETLREARISETVSIGNATYEVVAGDILRGEALPERERLAILQLAYEKASARRAPLMALEGSDPERLRIAAARLADAQAMLSQLQTSPEARDLVASRLYPVDFLRAIATLEEARQRFLASGSKDAALAYRTAGLDAAAAYRQSVRDFRYGFVKAVPSDVRAYATGNALVSRERIWSLTDALEGAATAMRDRLRSRAACFEGAHRACSMEMLAHPLHGFATSSERAPTGTPAGMGAWSQILGDSLLTRPLFELAASRCVADEGGAVRIALRKSASEGPTYLTALSMEDLRLVDAERHRDVPFYAFFAERGIRFIPNTGLYSYQCPEAPWDTGKALTMAQLAKEMLPNAALVKEIELAASLERAQRDMEKGELPADEAHTVSRRLLMAANYSASTEDQVLAIADAEMSDAKLASQGLPLGTGAAELFYTRSAFPTLFMLANPSFGTRLAPLFPGNTLPAQERPFVYYADLPPSARLHAVEDIAYYLRIHDTWELTP